MTMRTLVFNKAPSYEALCSAKTQTYFADARKLELQQLCMPFTSSKTKYNLLTGISLSGTKSLHMLLKCYSTALKLDV